MKWGDCPLQLQDIAAGIRREPVAVPALRPVAPAMPEPLRTTTGGSTGGAARTARQ